MKCTLHHKYRRKREINFYSKDQRTVVQGLVWSNPKKFICKQQEIVQLQLYS